MRLYYPFMAFLILAATVVFFLASLSIFFLSLPSQSVAAEDPTPEPVEKVLSSPRPQEVHIAGNGLVLLRSAKVVEVQATTLTVSVLWGRTDFKWVIRTNPSHYETRYYGTRFLNRDGENILPRDVQIQAGDLVTITGKLEGDTKEPTIIADTVRNLE